MTLPNLKITKILFLAAQEKILGDPKITEICTVILRICIGKVADLQYIFAVTSGSPSTCMIFFDYAEFLHKMRLTKVARLCNVHVLN